MGIALAPSATVVDDHNEAPEAAPNDPRALLLTAPMSRFQIVAIIVTLALCALDGFDVLAITFSAPAIGPEMGLNKAQLGYILSTGLLGMALGSLTLSPLADTRGRRQTLFISLALMVAGTLWTAFSASLGALIASRLLTGVGIGAMIGIIMPMAAEYANAQRRDLAVSLMTVGYPIGGILGGLTSAGLLAAFGWRSIFLLASGVGVVLAVAVYLCLHEPIAMIVTRPGKDGLARANAYLRRCGHGPVDRLPPPPVTPGVPMAALFAPDMLRDTLTIALVYFLYMIPQFYMQTWLPTLVGDAGLKPAQGALVSAFFSIGGVIAGLFVAATSIRLGLKRVEIVLLLGAGLMILVFSALPGRLGTLLGGAVVSGFFVMGAMVGMYAIISRSFPAHLRASGTGFVIGTGRLGSILPPILAGWLFVAGLDRGTVSIIMAAPALACVLVLATFRVRAPTLA
jgi:MFS family permease